MFKAIPLMVIFYTVSFGSTVSQTDWSGGSGVQGPVSDWNNAFWSTDGNVNCNDGELRLETGLIPPVEHKVAENFDGANCVCTADVDGDGSADIVGAAYNADDISWWENADGTGTTWIEHTVDIFFNGVMSVYCVDLDSDGDIDILGAAGISDRINWWENTDGTGTAWEQHAVKVGFNGARSVYSADIDNDGDPDVLGAGGDAIIWWENSNGLGIVWIEHSIDSSYTDAQSAYSNDLDGDGDLDVIGCSHKEGYIKWWENYDGLGTIWVEHNISGLENGVHSIFPSDIDGDGDADVVRIENSVSWWENKDGAGTSWEEHTIEASFSAGSSSYSTDIDGDNDIDVLGAAEADHEITWWENTDGAGTTWTEHVVDSDYYSASSVYAADINGDGDTDILGAAWDADEITWWDVLGFSSAGTLESSILDADSLHCWEEFTSSGDEPVGTSLGFQFRSSDDSANMGAWSDTVFTASTSLSGILADSTNFLQYRVILQTTDPTNTSVLDDVSFTYATYLGIVENDASSWNLTPFTNPSFGSFAVQVSVPQPGMVNLVLHGITGRVIAQNSQELPGGMHSVSFSNVSEGVYFCTMHAGDFTATERVVVLK